MEEKLNYSWVADGHLEIKFQDDFLAFSNDSLTNSLFAELQKKSLKKVSINTKSLKKWDSTLLVILFNIAKNNKTGKIKIDFSTLPAGLKSMLDLSLEVDRNPTQPGDDNLPFLESLGRSTINAVSATKNALSFLKEALFAIKRFFSGKATMRNVDFLFSMEDCSIKAFPIVALISFMIGLIFAFVGAMQLQLFGAQIYVASLVAIAMVRLMGAVMTGIIIAGRTGSSYAATIGTMQVNEEIDALKTMGIPAIDFLLLPRMIALIIMMPILTLFADLIGMFGGAVVGILMLGLSPGEYWKASLEALNVRHFMIGLFHGFVFGCVISICGCYHGIKCGRDADSVGKATTNAVVYSIIWIIVCTSVITITCQFLGI